MKSIRTLLLTLLVLLAASVGPMIFPAAQAGHGNLAELASHLLLPAIGLLIIITLVAWKWAPTLFRAVVYGALAGAIATVALEAVRIPGFRLGFMPGNLPRLMGVLLLDRFALGPSMASDLAGWAYHFWNGASFGITYVLLFGTGRRWVGTLYGFSLGLGFLVSPVVLSLGVGYFGLEFSKGFPVTVLAAHVAFGLALGILSRRFLGQQPSVVWTELRLFVSSSPEASEDLPIR